MSKKPFIPIILGTARKGRASEKVSTALIEILQEREDYEIELVDVKDHTAHGYTIASWEENEITAPWKEMAKKASAFIIVVPEYNHGYPGELKLALDQAYDEYANKPALVCSVSVGGFGGTRAVENLLPVLRALSLIVTANTLHVGDIKEFQADDKFKERTNKAVDNLIKLI
jgi:NAD(P)H-dependent FMN reductase